MRLSYLCSFFDLLSLRTHIDGERGDMYAVRLQFICKNLPLTFIQLADHTVESAIGIHVLQSQKIVLFVRHQSDRSSPAVWCGGPAQGQWCPAHLLVLLTEKGILNGTS